MLSEAKEEGIQITIRKYGIYPGTYYSWKKKLITEGEASLADQVTRRKNRHRLEQLEDEVSLLKQLLAEKDIKQVWLEGQGRYAYIPTVIDVFNRFVLHRAVGLQMKQADVKVGLVKRH